MLMCCLDSSEGWERGHLRSSSTSSFHKVKGEKFQNNARAFTLLGVFLPHKSSSEASEDGTHAPCHFCGHESISVTPGLPCRPTSGASISHCLSAGYGGRSGGSPHPHPAHTLACCLTVLSSSSRTKRANWEGQVK